MEAAEVGVAGVLAKVEVVCAGCALGACFGVEWIAAWGAKSEAFEEFVVGVCAEFVGVAAFAGREVTEFGADAAAWVGFFPACAVGTFGAFVVLGAGCVDGRFGGRTGAAFDFEVGGGAVCEGQAQGAGFVVEVAGAGLEYGIAGGGAAFEVGAACAEAFAADACFGALADVVAGAAVPGVVQGVAAGAVAFFCAFGGAVFEFGAEVGFVVGRVGEVDGLFDGIDVEVQVAGAQE